MKVKIYTKPVCQACKFTKKKLNQLGISYTEVPLGAEELDHILSLGYTAVPVVEVDYGEGVTTSWSGYRITHIEALAETLAPPG